MNETLHEPSQGAKYSLYYITAGALVIIWSAIWYYYLMNSNAPSGDTRYYVCTGLLLSGCAVLLIGVLVGRIGKEGKNADVPVGQVTAAAVEPQPAPAQPVNGVAAAPPAAANGAQPVGAPNQETAPRI